MNLLPKKGRRHGSGLSPRGPHCSSWWSCLHRSRFELATATLLLLACLTAMRSTTSAATGPLLRVSAVDVVGMTVSDMDRAVAFYTGVLPFAKVSERELSGRPYELLTGIFGARSRGCDLESKRSS